MADHSKKRRLGWLFIGIAMVLAFSCGRTDLTSRENPSNQNGIAIAKLPILDSPVEDHLPIAPRLRTVVLKIEVEGFRHSMGTCRVAVYLGSAHFNDSEYAFAKESIAIVDLRAKWQFELKVPVGSRLAVCAYHDENNNAQLDKSSFGIPTERYGFSRNPTRGFGPPKFQETAMELDSNEPPSGYNSEIEVPLLVK